MRKTSMAFAGMLLCLCGLACRQANGDAADKKAAIDKKAENKQAADKKIEVLNVAGEKMHPLDTKDSIATVFIFIAQDCPISNGYAPEVNALNKDYANHKIAFYVVYTENDSTLAAVKKHARDFNYQCGALYDPAHKIVNRVGAAVTPEAFVLSPEGKTLYQGRIDDKYIDFGKMRHLASTHDLRRVLDAIVENKPIPVAKTRAIGCFIPKNK